MEGGLIRVTQAMKEAYKITLLRVQKALEEVFLYITLCGSSEVLVFVFVLKIWLEPTNVCKKYWFTMNLE